MDPLKREYGWILEMVGYWENPKVTAETIVDDWLDTGDLMTVDADGYLWFHGRKKQIIVHDAAQPLGHP